MDPRIAYPIYLQHRKSRGGELNVKYAGILQMMHDNPELAGALMGGGAGALIDRKNRLRGGLLGAGAGFVGGLGYRGLTPDGRGGAPEVNDYEVPMRALENTPEDQLRSRIPGGRVLWNAPEDEKPRSFNMEEDVANTRAQETRDAVRRLAPPPRNRDDK